MSLNPVPDLYTVLRRAHARYGGLMVFDQDVERQRSGRWHGLTHVTWGDAPAFTPSQDWRSEVREALKGLPEGALLGGFFGYESGRWCEQMPAPAAPRPLPDIWLRPTQGCATLDHASSQWSVTGSARFQAEWAALAGRVQEHHDAPHRAAAPTPLTGPRNRYEAAVKRALSAIRNGEVYQVNVAWQNTAPPLADPLATWLDLRTANPARRGAYLQLSPHQAILSNSPETFLDVRTDGEGQWVESRPIKGTVPLSAGPAAREALASSVKERAELTMIVDLVRNDLGRVAPWGAVQTSERYLRECGDLLHAEQLVRAPLRQDCDALDAFAASFPPGSVTGAPKVRAMAMIAELEGKPRGVYTGAIGWLGAAGDASFNVAIRTITATADATLFHVGAGIVADSDPSAEWRETLAKGRRIHQALQRARHAD